MRDYDCIIRNTWIIAVFEDTKKIRWLLLLHRLTAPPRTGETPWAHASRMTSKSIFTLLMSMCPASRGTDSRCSTSSYDGLLYGMAELTTEPDKRPQKEIQHKRRTENAWWEFSTVICVVTFTAADAQWCIATRCLQYSGTRCFCSDSVKYSRTRNCTHNCEHLLQGFNNLMHSSEQRRYVSPQLQAVAMPSEPDAVKRSRDRTIHNVICCC
jgi:hypothetical protein